MTIPLLSIRNVTVVRGDAKLVDNISLTIQRGQNTVTLGRNGSGKSTLVKLITRQLFPTTGEPVEIFGRDAWNVSELRTRLGVVSSSLQLDMAQDDYSDALTQQQSKQLMRLLLAHYLGDKPLHTRQLLMDLQAL